MKRLYFLLLVNSIAASNVNGATITFEGIAPPAGYLEVEGSSIAIDGFSFVSTRKLFILSSSYFNVGTDRVDNGTDYLFFDTFLFGTPHSLLIRDGFGRPFTISSFDAVEANTSLPGAFTIEAVGNLVGGGTISQSFTTAPHPSGELGKFQGFAFSPAFTDLASLLLTASPATSFDEVAVDNLRITVVPEPTAMQLLFIGTVALFSILRRQRHSISKQC